MGFLDKAKEKATHLAEQAKEKIDDVKEKRKVDDLLDDLGRILYRQRTERGEPADEAEIARLVSIATELLSWADTRVTVDSPSPKCLPR